MVSVHFKPRPARGFTLIELLTVISIIALLASIVLPSIYAAKRMAWRAKCANNLRNMGIALQAYSAENNGWYPDRHDVSDPRHVNANWKTWFHDTGISPELMYCPLRWSGRVSDIVNDANHWGNINPPFAADPAPLTDYEVLVGGAKLGPLVSLWKRTDTVTLTDPTAVAGRPTNQVMLAGDYLAKQGSDWVGNHTDRATGGRAVGRNALFGDYHVSWLTLSQTDDTSTSWGGARTAYCTASYQSEPAPYSGTLTAVSDSFYLPKN